GIGICLALLLLGRPRDIRQRRPELEASSAPAGDRSGGARHHGNAPTQPEMRTMRIAIFGASGRTGRQLVEQAVAQGHEVTAIVRNPNGLPSDPQGAVRLVKADVMDPDAIAHALADADTVVSALSGPARAPSSVWSESTRSIVQAMRQASVRRYIAITGSM